MAVLVQIPTVKPTLNLVGTRTKNHPQSATPLTIFRYASF
jgi:hypothetical protein